MSDPTAGLVVDRLARRYGPRWAVAHVSFSVPAGTVCRLTGPNGSGKSTLLKCLATALKPQRGTATLDGVPLWRDRRHLRRRIAFLSHASRLYDDLSGRDNLRVWAALGGFDADPDALMRRVGLSPRRRDPARAYSAGMRKRLSLAIALLKQPRLLLLDEPFSALDPAGRALVVDVVAELRDRGAAVVLATHLPDAAAGLTDTTLHLEDGQVVSGAPT